MKTTYEVAVEVKAVGSSLGVIFGTGERMKAREPLLVTSDRIPSKLLGSRGQTRSCKANNLGM